MRPFSDLPPPSLHASLFQASSGNAHPEPLLGIQAFYSSELSSVVSLVLKVSTFKPDVSFQNSVSKHMILKKYSQREILRKQISLKYSYNLVLYICLTAIPAYI